MDTEKYAQAFIDHQNILLNNLPVDDCKVITAESNKILFEELEKIRLNAWNHPNICLVARNPKNDFEFEFKRGKQHTNLYNATTSFIATARNEYLSHLIAKNVLFSESCLDAIKDLMKASSSSQKCLDPNIQKKNTAQHIFIFFWANQSFTYEIKMTITAQYSCGNNYSGYMNVIAHQFPLSVKEYTLEEAENMLRTMIIYHWLPSAVNRHESHTDDTISDTSSTSSKNDTGTIDIFPAASEEEVASYRAIIAKDQTITVSENAKRWLEETFSTTN